MTALAEEQKAVHRSGSSHAIAELLLRFRELGIVLALVLVVGGTTIDNHRFLSLTNVQQVLSAASIIALLAIGETIVIITRNVDLSIGSVIGLSATVLVILFKQRGWAPLPAMLATLLTGCLIGLFHGILVTKLRVQAFVVTLCMSCVATARVAERSLAVRSVCMRIGRPRRLR